MSNALHPAYVGLGSNLDDPAAQVEAALDSLKALPETHLVARSRLYLNPPMGPQDQPDYINAVAALSTRLAAHDLLAALQQLERDQGRVREGRRWGPRVIDLDLLVYADAVIDAEGLRVPHPGLSERPFVLAPLAEIAPQLQIPGLGSVTDLLAAVDTSGLVALGGPCVPAARP